MYLSQSDINKLRDELLPTKVDNDAFEELNEKITNLQKTQKTALTKLNQHSSGSIGVPESYQPVTQTHSDLENRLDAAEASLKSLERQFKVTVTRMSDMERTQKFAAEQVQKILRLSTE